MSEPISLLSTILWALASGLIGVGIGITFMCVFITSGEADDIVKANQRNILTCKTGHASGLSDWPSDLARGKSAKEGQ